MAAVLNVYREVGVEVDGVADGYGDKNVPIKPVSITTGLLDQREILIPAGGTATLWKWESSADNFARLAVLCDGDAFLSMKADAPTSPTNNTPAGTSVNWHTERYSCFDERVWTNILTRVNTNQATLAGTAFGGSGTTDGRHYELVAKAVDPTKPLKVWVTRIA
jgi:hypothetical protein